MIMVVLEDKKILHYPRLDTVMMVETAIRASNGVYSRTELWNNLEKKTIRKN